MTTGAQPLYYLTIVVAALGLLSAATLARAQDKPANKPAEKPAAPAEKVVPVEKPAVKIPGAQLAPVAWHEMEGWAEDDHAAALATFLVSCEAILKGSAAKRAARPLLAALYEVCGKAVELQSTDAKAAREFFEQNFRPARISPLSDPNGFVTGYYEPIVEGRRQPVDDFVNPLYRRPANLMKGGRMLGAAKFTPKPTWSAPPATASKAATKAAPKGTTKTAATKAASKKLRIAGKRRLIPFHDRAAIEDGALKGRDLEICYLKDPVDSFFIHIQGSARVRLEDGTQLRLNYVAANGHAYTAVGRYLIERNLITREAMSMEAIRQWIYANPDEGRDLMRKNKSYVFFRETGLGDQDEPIGAQGVSLTVGRSIAVDRHLHVYGTPFFIQAELPIDSEQPTTRFRRLMVAQDTGGAILGPARADLYWGAGVEAGVISGRFKHPGRFVMLFPNSVDPFVQMREVPLPKPRPKTIPVAEPPAKKPIADKLDVKQPAPKARKPNPAT